MDSGIVALLKKLEDAGAPGRRFWTDDLEIAVADVLRPAMDEDGDLEEWIAKRTGYQVAILCRHFKVDGDLSVQKQRVALLEHGEALLPYVLVAGFGKGRSRVAVVDVAKDKLPAAIVEVCRKGTRRPPAMDEQGKAADEDGEEEAADTEEEEEEEEDYDTLALLFALYGADPKHLRLVFHNDKVQKTGFARMTLATQAQHPGHSLGTALRHAELAKILKVYDGSKKDGRRSDLKGVVSNEDRFLVFIRRPERPEHILDDGEVRHGYFPEWIVLDFEEGAKRVKISSRSNDVPLEIANCVASAFFGKPCEYENEVAVTQAAQIKLFLATLTASPSDTLSLVEVLVGSSPLPGAVKIRLTSTGTESVGPAVEDFGAKVGNLLDAVDAIESVKVVYRRKRVSLILEEVEGKAGEYIVRYSDHRLNGFERSPFEDYMRNTHGIDILSTEKRSKRR